MQLIIVDHLKKLKLISEGASYKVVDSWEALDSTDRVDTFFVAHNQIATEAVKKADRVIVPSTEAEKFLTAKEMYVYFDLAAYPFFQKLQQIIEADVKKKGVLRLHRATKQQAFFPVCKEDILVCTYLFGEVCNLYVKHSSSSKQAHTVIMVQFTTGAIAHLEYTTTNYEKLTFDWSGDRMIAEFDSIDMAPIKTTTSPDCSSSLYHTIDTVLSSCKPLNSKLQNKMNNLENQLKKAGWSL
ncbi:hypothetical protein [Virgibacillus pantothenticus]|uniref:hypothetical protein n=1 Tax=Virgibacillus pantothenticus TaxID=1473 RepID=UPI000987005F|nr:hypothetical protein [Virgibacillus pantothenticus]